MLKIQDLKVTYGHTTALEGVNMQVDTRETVSLIGANGAGKSTLLKAISGIVKPASGSITFNDIELTKLPTNQIVKAGVIHVPEGKHIFPEMTVVENLEMGASLRKDREGIKKDIDYVFELFPRLKERATQKGGTMSGGEQQMLAMARGLMPKPKLLMLDEPSLGVAPLVVKEIMRAITEMRDSGMTILLIEQNAQMALKTSNRTYVLETGCVSMEGPSSEMLTDERIRKAYLGG